MVERRRFEYQPREYSDVNQRATQPVGNYDTIYKEQVPSFKPREGVNCVRIMPPTWTGARHYGYDVFVHNDIGADHGQYLCLKEMAHESCPICDFRAKISSEGASNEELVKLRPSRRVLVWIINRDLETTGPMLWNMSPSQDKDISAQCLDKRRGTVYLIDDPEKGFDLEFEREGQGLKTEYRAYRLARDPSYLSDNEKEMDRWLDYIMDNEIPSLLQFKEPEYIESVFRGQRDSTTVDEEEVQKERTPMRRAGRGEEEKDSPLPNGEDQDEKPRRVEREERSPPPRAARESDRSPPSRADREPPSSRQDRDPPPRRRQVKEDEEEVDDDPHGEVSRETRQRLANLGRRGAEKD